MVQNGPFEKMKYEQGMNVPAGCQVQSGGYNYRAILHRCICRGRKDVQSIRQMEQTLTWPLWWKCWSKTSVRNHRLQTFPTCLPEMNKLLPLIRQPLVTDWSVTSSNASVKAWPRSYNGVPYVIPSNTAGTSQTTTPTFSGGTELSHPFIDSNRCS